MSVGITVGTRFPAFATSMGRVLLATLDARQLDAYFADAEMAALTTRTLHDEDSIRHELAAVRSQGWALVDQELEIGLRSMGAPVYAGGGKPVAAINVSTSVGADDADALKEIALVALLDAARAISDDLAMRP
jgi:IclR family transcriptional regulator, pca regulon regulatory protein